MKIPCGMFPHFCGTNCDMYCHLPNSNQGFFVTERPILFGINKRVLRLTFPKEQIVIALFFFSENNSNRPNSKHRKK